MLSSRRPLKCFVDQSLTPRNSTLICTRECNGLEDGRIKCFNLREGPADGDQDLNLWTRELEDLVREIMEDPVFKGNQNFSFELDLDAAGQRLFGGEANAGVAFQIGQLRYIQ